MYPILFETYSLLLRRVSPTVAHQWLHETTANGRVIVPANADYVEAGERVRSYQDQAITLFDALLAVMSDHLKVPVWTYDHHFDVMRISVGGNTQSAVTH